ncbi:MAG TPA: helix-hairpin-helix domain-containing protein [Nitrospira sp.]|nr:helix-hairpin-helix domain-containing protein [Nitrospira sp.]
MIASLLLKFCMIAVTMGLVFWIGWTVPEEVRSERDSAVATLPPFSVEQPAADVVPSAPPLKMGAVASKRNASSSDTPTNHTLDLNSATEEELESLPGIGPVLAGRIIEHRTTIGAFDRVEDLREVKGIGKKKFERIRSLVRITHPAVPAKQGKKT